MRILIAGNFQYFWYEEVCAKALESLGHTVCRFSWKSFFSHGLGKIEQYFVFSGLATAQANNALKKEIVSFNPDILFIWRGVHISAKFLRHIKHIHSKLICISYNNDDPFSPHYINSKLLNQRRLWKNFIKAIPEYDLNFVYRPVNIKEYKAAGAKSVELLLPYFIPEVHQPVKLTFEEKQLYECDVVFIGHYEHDSRAECLKALVYAGFSIKLWGTGWPDNIVKEIFGKYRKINAVYGNDYVKALCGAKICLTFFSKLNRDDYTRRSFEIPACGPLMLSERSKEIAALFLKDKEAMFFSSPKEVVEKTKALVQDDRRRKSIAQAGMQRCWEDGYDVVSRMKKMLEHIKNNPI